MTRSSRRAVLLALVGLPLAACTGPWEGAPGDAAPVAGRDLTLIYVGARDCGFCRWWEAEDEPAFLASGERGRVSYRRLIFERFADTTSDAVWPEDIRWVRDTLGIRQGTPRFVLIERGQIVLHTGGINGWREEVLPRIQAAAAPRSV
jgi:hypothetical protein